MRPSRLRSLLVAIIRRTSAPKLTVAEHIARLHASIDTAILTRRATIAVRQVERDLDAALDFTTPWDAMQARHVS